MRWIVEYCCGVPMGSRERASERAVQHSYGAEVAVLDVVSKFLARSLALLVNEMYLCTSVVNIFSNSVHVLKTTFLSQRLWLFRCVLCRFSIIVEHSFPLLSSSPFHSPSVLRFFCPLARSLYICLISAHVLFLVHYEIVVIHESYEQQKRLFFIYLLCMFVRVCACALCCCLFALF